MNMCHFYIYKEIYKYMFSKAAFNSLANNEENHTEQQQPSRTVIYFQEFLFQL